MTVRELIYESGIDIQTEYQIRHYNEDKDETEEINESDALDMEIKYMYYDKYGNDIIYSNDIIIVFEV